MGQNSDIHNIFESYAKKVLIKEQTLLRADEIPGAESRLTQIQNPEAKAKAQELINKSKEAIKNPGISLASGNGAQMNLSGGGGTQTSSATAPQAATNASLSLNPQTTDSDFNKYRKEQEYKKTSPRIPTNYKELEPPLNQNPPQGYDYATKQYGLNANNNFEGNVNLQGANPYDTNKTDFSSINNAGGTNSIDKNPLQLQPDANIQAAQPTKTKGGKSSSGSGSIVDYLAGKNQASDKASRAKLAAQNGIQNYTGTAEQNTQLLNKLKANEKMPQGTNATGDKQPQQQPQKQQPQQQPQKQQPQQQPQKQQPQQQPQKLGGAIGAVSQGLGGAGNLAKKALVGSDKPLGGALGLASKAIGGAGNLIKKGLIGGGEQQAPQEDEENIQENKNIAKFLKCLSEKNYAHANVYLKNIVNAKVKNNLSKVINRI